MRLWSLHPRHLDQQGLVAWWRESLLAQAVLAGRTRGYTLHPQLDRFREQPHPLQSIAAYLDGIADEADVRGYRFDRTRIVVPRQERTDVPLLAVTRGQVTLEWGHLLTKLEGRSIELWRRTRGESPDVHPLMMLIEGPAAPWERTAPGSHAAQRGREDEEARDRDEKAQTDANAAGNKEPAPPKEGTGSAVVG